MQVYQSDIPLRIETLTQDQTMNYKLQDLLTKCKVNALTIVDYLESIKNEINPSLSY